MSDRKPDAPEEQLYRANLNEAPEAHERGEALARTTAQIHASQMGADLHHMAGPGVAELDGPMPSGGVLYPLGLLAIALAVAGVFLLWSHKAHAEKAEGGQRTSDVAQGPLIRVATVQKAAGDRAVQLPGEVHAWQQATLYAKVSGYLKTILVDKGDRVKANQLLATLESPETDQQVIAAQADLELKRQLAERSRNLSKSGVVSEQDLENANSGEKVAIATLRRAQATKAYEEIRAPFAGVVTARYVDVGALLPAATGSTTSAQPVVDVGDLSRLRIWTYLGQDDAAQVQVGDTAKVTFDPRPGEVRIAKVARLSQSLDARTRTMLTELVLDNKDGALYPGEFVHIELTLRARMTPLIPAEALIVRTGKLYVAVIDGGRAHLKEITVGADDGKVLQVSSGLSGGEQVAINAAGEIVDNGAVRIDGKNSQTGAVSPAR